jgi:hypothetical protein
MPSSADNVLQVRCLIMKLAAMALAIVFNSGGDNMGAEALLNAIAPAP